LSGGTPGQKSMEVGGGRKHHSQEGSPGTGLNRKKAKGGGVWGGLGLKAGKGIGDKGVQDQSTRGAHKELFNDVLVREKKEEEGLLEGDGPSHRGMKSVGVKGALCYTWMPLVWRGIA